MRKWLAWFFYWLGERGWDLYQFSMRLSSNIQGDGEGPWNDKNSYIL